MAGNDLNRAYPVIDFVTSDAESITTDLIAYAKATHGDKWTDFNVGQLGRVFLDLIAYYGDLNAFHLNALINEAFLTTALRRQNILDQSKALDYVPGSASASTVELDLAFDPLGTYPCTLDAQYDKFSTGGNNGVVFMPAASQTFLTDPGTVTVACVEGDQQLDELIGTSTGAANQRFLLQRRPMIDGTLTVRVDGVPWTKADHAVDMRAADLEYLVETDDEDNTYIVFGDGVNGTIPPATQAVSADYKVGGGKRGNVGTGTITTIVSADPAILSVSNAAAASGGADRATNDAVRRAAPAALNAHTGAINGFDIADVALTVTGVGKAFAVPGNPLLRTHDLYVAPSSGGVPSSALKVAIQNALKSPKMLGMLVSVRDPVYKPFALKMLVHVAAGARQAEIKSLVETHLSNTDLTGILDFDQLDFGGVDANSEPLVNITRLQREIKELDDALIRRVEISRLYVKTGGRTLRTNTGNGTLLVTGDTVNDVRRREYSIRFTNATTFNIYERIIGRSRSVSNTGIVDDTQDFTVEAPTGLVAAGFTTLNPNRNQTQTYTIASNTANAVTTSVGGVLTVAEAGSEYYIERFVAIGSTGTIVEIADALLQVLVIFGILVGTSPFVSGDEFIIDTYPQIGDLVLRNDEIPTLDAADLEIRVAGGIAQ